MIRTVSGRFSLFHLRRSRWATCAIIVVLFAAALGGCSSTSSIPSELNGCGADPWFRTALSDLQVIATQAGSTNRPYDPLTYCDVDSTSQVSVIFATGSMTQASDVQNRAKASRALQSNGWRQVPGSPGCFTKSIDGRSSTSWVSLAGDGAWALTATSDMSNSACKDQE